MTETELQERLAQMLSDVAYEFGLSIVELKTNGLRRAIRARREFVYRADGFVRPPRTSKQMAELTGLSIRSYARMRREVALKGGASPDGRLSTTDVEVSLRVKAARLAVQRGRTRRGELYVLTEQDLELAYRELKEQQCGEEES